jgi:hypothetical protein
MDAQSIPARHPFMDQSEGRGREDDIYAIWKLTAEELWAMGYRKCEPEAPPVPMKISKDNPRETPATPFDEEAWRWEIARDALREAEEWRKETLLREAPAAEGLHEGWWRKRDELWRQREAAEEIEREKWRKRDEKAAAFWRQLEAEKAARGQP